MPAQNQAPLPEGSQITSKGALPEFRRCVSVQEGYRRWAESYDTGANPLLALEGHSLESLIEPVEGKVALDLACGSGRWTNWLISKGAAPVVGVDLSSEMLAVANRKPALHHRLIQADCRSLPLPDGVFDVVICSFALGHFDGLGRLARELERVTKAGADIYLSDLHPEAYLRGWRTGFRDHLGAIEITTWPRPMRALLAAWNCPPFECVSVVECRFTELERPIFVRAGRSSLFEEVCHMPAVLLCQIKHLPRPFSGDPHHANPAPRHHRA